MAEDNKMKRCPATLQPDIEELLDWNNYSADDFDSASQTEKKDFIQERQSVPYWKDAWRRLKKNVVAMATLGVIIFLLVLATMMIPEQVIMIPLFQMFQKVGLIDTHLGLILPTAFCYPFGIFMLRQFIMGLPDSIMEAGKIDGCSYPGIFFKLTLPLIKPALSSLFIFSFLQNWNSFLYPMLFLNSQEKFTLPLMLNTFKGLYFTDWPVLMAACSIVILPVVLVYLSAQKYIIEGIAMTGIKG